jgi:quercetin dioxygenase-like cupin family protein
MLTRRGFAACALCAVSGFIASGAKAQSAAPAGFKRIVISQTDGPAEGYVTVIARLEAEAGVAIPRHTHPGVESTYLVAGSMELSIEGQPTRALAAGDGFQVPAGVPHAGKNGGAPAILVSTYVVEKGKPLASPA